MFRLSFLAVVFWFLLGLSSGWWLYKTHSENSLRYQTSASEQGSRQARPTFEEADIESKKPTRDKKEKNLTRQLFAGGEYNQVLSRYKTLINQNPDSDAKEVARHALLLNIGNLMDKDPRRALLLLERFKQIDPYDPLALFLLARAYFVNEQYQRAKHTQHLSLIHI